MDSDFCQNIITRPWLCLGLVLYSGYRPHPWAITTTYTECMPIKPARGGMLFMSQGKMVKSFITFQNLQEHGFLLPGITHICVITKN